MCGATAAATLTSILSERVGEIGTLGHVRREHARKRGIRPVQHSSPRSRRGHTRHELLEPPVRTGCLLT